MKSTWSLAAIFFALLCVAPTAWGQAVGNEASELPGSSDTDANLERASAVFAGGCFWCVETDFEKCPGVINVISGYSGGRTKNPTYETYKSGGHREVVFVAYDPKQVTYAGLVEWLVKHVDATDRTGQFNDRGKQYSPCIYYANEEEKAAADSVVAALTRSNVFRRKAKGGRKLNIDMEERSPFWPAEEYHQDYHRKNALKYQAFRALSGRDAFLWTYWGARASKLELAGAFPEEATAITPDEMLVDKGAATNTDEAKKKPEPWKTFEKPSMAELRRKLSPIQFKVTQLDGTEPAHGNAYWNNKQEGIYVDVVSGAPLFSSKDKYKSGTGWPSFVKPIEEDAVMFRQDRKMFYTRIEVRSRYGDSHLGHVFDDGPPARGGKRYCMNSAAMRFIPKDRMEAEGYGEYLKLFENPSTNDTSMK